MILYTSNYARHAKDPKAISISLGGGPYWFRGPQYPDLAPTPELLEQYKAGKVDERGYLISYLQTLKDRKLDPQKVAEELGDERIMLCYETPTAFCHRHIVAWWIETNTGIKVYEHFLHKQNQSRIDIDLIFGS